MSGRLDVREVRALADGHWDHVFAMLAPSLGAAMERPGRHCPCPVHGGRDAFRLYRNYAENGACVCNTCGARRDGLATLMWVNGWDFRTALARVAEVFSLAPDDAMTVVESHEVGARFVGTVAFMGLTERKPWGCRVFTLVLAAEGGGSASSQTFFGTGLRRAVENASVSPGDRVELTLLTRQVLRSRRTGKSYSHQLWRALRLPPAEEERRLARERQVRQRALGSAIRTGWRDTVPFSWTDAGVRPMARYLKSRALAVRNPGLVSGLRFSPTERYRDADGADGIYPAMVAAVRSVGGDLITLHRTFLTEEGCKAAVPAPKKLLPMPDDRTVNGAAIHFGEPQAVLALAEGVETALSVAVATGLPCWSCISAGGLERVEIPGRVTVVFVFADKDRSGTGERAAGALQKRLAQSGRTVCVLVPSGEIPDGAKGIDWNDVLRDGGAFPVAG